MRLKDKVAIVTGAGSGNGAEIAVGYLKEGAKVVFADINMDAANEIAKGSGFPEDKYSIDFVDVTDGASVQKLVNNTVEKFGRIDVMFANAGINIRKHLLELTESDYDKVMNINAKGVFLCSQEAARQMVKQKSGSIIHMSSATTLIAEPNMSEYGASKGAILAMTRHMALDLGIYNVRVNGIAPGTMQTNLTKERLKIKGAMERETKSTMLHRVGHPRDLVGLAVFLASEESSFITAQQISVDAGYTLKGGIITE
ncbi:SDR family NAD(P)-dependent oxidoreductase [Oceanobacillus jeddahense]|uniref:SDR family NAD(P)-dependent oxidoreductase n=1 Tax=Oceanobacillus jeddahense TaxID=1462527 RepID=UPI0036261D15